MFDLPLHPLAVHFPIALGVLIPFFALFTLWAIRRGYVSNRAWYFVVCLAGLFFGLSLLAAELGERDEDQVEKFVSEAVIEAHEEAGEKVPWFAGVVFLSSLLPLVTERKTKFQMATVALSAISLVPLVLAGHTGAELVYKHGAANAYREIKNERL